MARTGTRSVERQLPALMCVLLLAAMGALSAIAYNQLERSLMLGVRDRLHTVSELLSDLLGRSMDTRVQRLEALAGSPEVGAYLRAPDDEGRARVAAVLAELPGTASAVQAVELWGPGGECVLSVPRGRGEEPAAGTACVASTSSLRGPGGIGAIRAGEGAALFDISAPVRVPPDPETPGAGGPLVGHVVEVGRLANPESAALIEALIGSEASFLLGNAPGDAWTDLAGVVPGPPLEGAEPDELIAYTGPDGERRVGMAAALPGTPWVVWLEFPRSAALAPLGLFLERTALATVVILLLGALAAWGLGRRIAVPLREVTGAAEAMAAGRYSGRVNVGRQDEIGRLGGAFNAMADQVEEHQRELERRVEDRTSEVRSALRRLQETQDQLVRREKLAILGQLASGVGHELRNPLGVMSNAVYYLDMVIEDPRPEVKEYLGILRNQIGLSEKIVEDLLDFARVRPPQRERAPLAEIVDEQLGRLGPTNGVVVERQFPDDLPHPWVDRVQTGQVVLNLLSNAVQAMEGSGGTLTLRGSTAEPGRVRLEVVDTGAGMEPDTLAKIFEPLFTTRARGIGLGLAVARSLAEANEGSLSAASRPDGGSTFTLDLPARDGARA